MPEFIFTMQNVTRVHPPEKRVLEDITLAFFPGAKIGVIGTNGGPRTPGTGMSVLIPQAKVV